MRHYSHIANDSRNLHNTKYEFRLAVPFHTKEIDQDNEDQKDRHLRAAISLYH